jgi:ferredoxin
MVAKIDIEKCDGCGTCVEACPAEAIKLENEKAVVDEEECVDCETCVDECPNSAISME